MHILICISAKEMFQKICSIYERDTEKQKYLLLQEFFNYKYQRGQDIAAHVSTIQNMAYKLKVLNMVIDDTMIMTKLFVTLRDIYKYFASAWDSTPSDQKTLINFTARLLAEKSKENILQEKEELLVFKSVVKKQVKNEIRKSKK